MDYHERVQKLSLNVFQLFGVEGRSVVGMNKDIKPMNYHFKPNPVEAYKHT